MKGLEGIDASHTSPQRRQQKGHNLEGQNGVLLGLIAGVREFLVCFLF